VACVRAFFITLSLSVPQRSPRSTEYSSQGNVRRIPVLAG
jgi:hypothetical protein